MLSPTVCIRPGTTAPLAARARNRQITAAQIIMATTELVIDRSIRPTPGRFTGGRATTFSMANWCSGSIAAIGPLSSLPWGLQPRLILVIVVEADRLGRPLLLRRLGRHGARLTDDHDHRDHQTDQQAADHAQRACVSELV